MKCVLGDDCATNSNPIRYDDDDDDDDALLL